MVKTILVVDDEPDVTEFLGLELNDDGFNVITENSGYAALNHLMKGEADLLITDIAMPDMDGHELFTRARDLDENFPVIMMTGFGYDPNHVVVNCKKDGLKDVIFKPFDMEKLLKKIHEKLDD